jgi:hypothetical protein
LLAAAILVTFGMSFMDVAAGFAEESAAARLPANYWQLIAQYILA